MNSLPVRRKTKDEGRKELFIPQSDRLLTYAGTYSSFVLRLSSFVFRLSSFVRKASWLGSAAAVYPCGESALEDPYVGVACPVTQGESNALALFVVRSLTVEDHVALFRDLLQATHYLNFGYANSAFDVPVIVEVRRANVYYYDVISSLQCLQLL